MLSIVHPEEEEQENEHVGEEYDEIEDDKKQSNAQLNSQREFEIHQIVLCDLLLSLL